MLLKVTWNDPFREKAPVLIQYAALGELNDPTFMLNTVELGRTYTVPSVPFRVAPWDTVYVALLLANSE